MTGTARRRFTAIFVCVLSALTISAPAWAQGSEERPLEPGIGYRVVHASQGGFGATYGVGFHVQLARDLRRDDKMAVGVVAQYGLSFRSDDFGSERLSMLQGGVRLQWARAPITPYVKGLAGITRAHFSYEDFGCESQPGGEPGGDDDECEDFGQTDTAFSVGAEAGIRTAIGPRHSLEIGAMVSRSFFYSGKTTIGFQATLIILMEKLKKGTQ
jgi:hypothetical protein